MQANMAATSYINGLLAVMPDVIDSLDVVISSTAVSVAPLSAKENRAKDTLDLAKSLREAIGCVQEALYSDGEYMNDDILRALNDSAECCRLLAPALSPVLGGEDGEDRTQSAAASWSNQSGRVFQVARRVRYSMEFLCNIAHL